MRYFANLTAGRLDAAMIRTTGFQRALALMAVFQLAMAGEPSGDRAMVVIDLRPQEERDGTGLTPLTGACNQDVYRVADAASKPAKVAALQSDLDKLLGAAADGKTLTVLNWTVYYNKQLNGGQPWAKIVPIGGMPLPGTNKNPGSLPGSKCTRQESGGGWFDPSEVTGTHSPLVSVFEGTYAGTPIGVRIVHSPKRKIEGKFKGDSVDSLAVLNAVHETAAALAAILPVSRN